MTSSWSPPSSSSNATQIKYDVFISFRGLDTRHGFLSHLLRALRQKKIDIYVDDKLEEGSDTWSALCKAIEESQIALIIFSEDYASSKWCLEELVKITECMTENGQIVVPIFYNVDPSDVRHQKGRYRSAFAEHEKRFKGNIMKWRAALKKVANLAGFHSTNFGPEAELIEKVVQRVLTRLNHMPQVDLRGLVGINKPIVDLQSLIFSNGSQDVRVIGIWGMGGIDKTTIAGSLFSILRSEYEGYYFLANVREQLKKYQTIHLRDQLLSILSEEKDLNNGIPNGAPAHVLRRLRRMKVLIVLDDVINSYPVTNLVGGRDWLGLGSRIIVTTRDKDVLCKEANNIYEVKALKSDEALKLLSLHAFNEKCLQIDCYNFDMWRVVQYAQGVPLALKVLGSFLYGKSVKEWESQLQKLQKMPFPEIQNILRLSYEGLDREEMDIFLYLACFFEDDDNVKILLDACGYSTAIALRTLHDRALRVDSKFGEYTMHDLIKEMGREIFREQNIENPGKRSHLWDPNVIAHVLKHDEGTKCIESKTLDMLELPDLSLSPHLFAGMVNLKFFRFYNYLCSGSVHLPEGLTTLPDELRLFHWDNYPLKSLPATFNAKNLVQLRMRRSHVEKLWDGAPDLQNLMIVDLEDSKQLIELPNFSNAPRLEKLLLLHCTGLLSIYSSIFYLPELKVLDLYYCERLESLPAIEALPSSERCPSKLDLLNLNGCKSLKYLPDSISELRFLITLDVQCKQLDTSNLHILFDGLSSLQALKLDGCSNLCELPENISKLSLLDWLSLTKTNVKSLPESIKHLSKLRCLWLNNCRRLQSLPELPASVYCLQAVNCTSLERVFTPTPQLLEEHIRLFEIEPYFDYFFGFSFKNCPNLDKDALDAILAYDHYCSKRRRAIWEKCTEKQRHC